MSDQTGRTLSSNEGTTMSGDSHHPPRTICGTTCCTTPSSKGTSRRFVDLIEIDMQRVAGWPDFHPEDYCHRCGGRNVYSWHAPNEVWNRLAETGLLPSSEIVCPQCFTDLARQIGVEPSVWHLVADGSAS